MKKYAIAMAAAMMMTSGSALAAREENKLVQGIYMQPQLITFNLKNPVNSGTACYAGLMILRDTRSVSTQTFDPVLFQSQYSGLLAALRAGSPVTVDYTATSTGCFIDQINFY
jgi:hypothetical protein